MKPTIEIPSELAVRWRDVMGVRGFAGDPLGMEMWQTVAAAIFDAHLPHVWFKCECDRTGCMFCDGGLSLCTVCGAFEGQLLDDCPGVKQTEEQLDDAYERALPERRELQMAAYRNGLYVEKTGAA